MQATNSFIIFAFALVCAPPDLNDALFSVWNNIEAVVINVTFVWTTVIWNQQ